MKETTTKQLEIEGALNKEIYFSIIESLLFASGNPLELKNIASIIKCDIKYTKELMKEMEILYEKKEFRGIKIINLNNSYQLVTKRKNSNYVQKLLKTNVRQSISQASLETLAIIAYKHPITRIAIDEIRGVKSDKAINTLLEKGLVEQCGKAEAPGRPLLYRTTNEFLKSFGLKSLDELPNIESFLDNLE